MSSSQDNTQKVLKNVNGLNIVESQNGLNHNDIHTYKPSRSNFNPKDYMVTESLSLVKIVCENGPSPSKESSIRLSKDLEIEKKRSCTNINAMLDYNSNKNSSKNHNSNVDNEDIIVMKSINEFKEFKEIGVQNNLGDDLFMLSYQPPPPYQKGGRSCANQYPQWGSGRPQPMPQNYVQYQYQYGPNAPIQNQGNQVILPPYSQYPIRNGPEDQHHRGFGQSWAYYDSEEYFFDESVLFRDPKVRRNFIKKVYALLAILLLLTTAIVIPFVVIEDVKIWAYDHGYLFYVALATYFTISIALSCCPDVARFHPLNLILLFILAISISICLGFFSALFDTYTILLSLVTTVIVCTCVSLLAIYTSFDLTKYIMVFLFFMLVMLLFAIVCVIVSIFTFVPVLHIIYSLLMLILMIGFLMLETQLIMGGRRYQISPEDYINAVLVIYLDIIMIFISLMNLIGSSRS